MSQALRLYRTLDIHRTEYSSNNEDDRNDKERSADAFPGALREGRVSSDDGYQRRS